MTEGSIKDWLLVIEMVYKRNSQEIALTGDEASVRQNHALIDHLAQDVAGESSLSILNISRMTTISSMFEGAHSLDDEVIGENYLEDDVQEREVVVELEEEQGVENDADALEIIEHDEDAIDQPQADIETDVEEGGEEISELEEARKMLKVRRKIEFKGSQEETRIEKEEMENVKNESNGEDHNSAANSNISVMEKIKLMQRQKCFKCNEQFQAFKQLKRHIFTHYNLALDPFKNGKNCVLCEQKFTDSNDFRKHILISHDILQQLEHPNIVKYLLKTVVTRKMFNQLLVNANERGRNNVEKMSMNQNNMSTIPTPSKGIAKDKSSTPLQEEVPTNQNDILTPSTSKSTANDKSSTLLDEISANENDVSIPSTSKVRVNNKSSTLLDEMSVNENDVSIPSSPLLEDTSENQNDLLIPSTSKGIAKDNSSALAEEISVNQHGASTPSTSKCMEKAKPNNLLLCFRCEKNYRNLSDLLTHMSVVHFYEELKRSNGTDKQCSTCSKIFPTRSSLFRHVGAVHRKVWEFLPLEVQNELSKRKRQGSDSSKSSKEDASSTLDQDQDDKDIFLPLEIQNELSERKMHGSNFEPSKEGTSSTLNQNQDDSCGKLENQETKQVEQYGAKEGKEGITKNKKINKSSGKKDKADKKKDKECSYKEVKTVRKPDRQDKEGSSKEKKQRKDKKQEGGKERKYKRRNKERPIMIKEMGSVTNESNERDQNFDPNSDSYFKEKIRLMQTLKCYKCAEQFQSFKQLKLHIFHHYQSALDPFKNGTTCVLCEQKNFKSPNDFRRHILMGHKILLQLEHISVVKYLLRTRDENQDKQGSDKGGKQDNKPGNQDGGKQRKQERKLGRKRSKPDCGKEGKQERKQDGGKDVKSIVNTWKMTKDCYVSVTDISNKSPRKGPQSPRKAPKKGKIKLWTSQTGPQVIG